MLAFSLSKMNLLILVTAVFAIIAYFMFALVNIVIVMAAQEIVNEKANEAWGVVNAETHCFQKPINIQPYIRYFGASRYYYAMKISRYPAETVPGEKNTLIFSIVERKQPDKIIAAKRIDIDAEVVLFGWKGSDGLDILEETQIIVLDPQAEVPSNSFVLVKEVHDDKTYLYIIACAFGSGGSTFVDCMENPDFVGCSSFEEGRGNQGYVVSGNLGSLCLCNMQDVGMKINNAGACIANPNVPEHNSECFPTLPDKECCRTGGGCCTGGA
ncbi:MAG: hypothetical protein JW772_01615 [Candidatus Diapherotrites archaeon]|nr:hypothetical protein [Candidatus Diapherotrites archaeon]